MSSELVTLSLEDLRTVLGDALRSAAECRLLMTIRELAIALQLSERTLWGMRSAGELPAAIKIGKSLRWRRVDIEGFLAERARAARAKQAPEQAP